MLLSLALLLANASKTQHTSVYGRKFTDYFKVYRLPIYNLYSTAVLRRIRISASILFEAASILFALHENFTRSGSRIDWFETGRWVKVDPSRFNECGGRCRIEVRVFHHVA